MRRGQVTIFVIIGLVLLILTGLVLYFFVFNAKNTEIGAPEVSKELKPIQNYVDECIFLISMEGMSAMGRHGGYISLFNDSYAPEDINYDLIRPTESDIIFLNGEDEDSALPYWFYAKSRTNCWHCALNTLTPSLAFMEYQLARYIEYNLPSCINNYSAFTAQNIDITELSPINATVSIRDTDVVVFLNYSINVKNGNDNSQIDYFVKTLDLPLKKYYLLALNITQNEISNEYLDAFTLYLITQYGGLDINKFPPLSTYAQDYAVLFWSKTLLTNKFVDMLYFYMPLFNINGTTNYQTYTIPGNTLETIFYNAMSLNMIALEDRQSYNLNNLEVNFLYSGQPIYFNVRPSKGDLITPDTTSSGGGMMSSVLPENNYKFFYDISYPVTVEIRDKSRDDNFVFIFALQSTIKENKLLSDWLSGRGTIPWSDDYITASIDDPAEGKTLFDPYTNQNYKYTSFSSDTKILFCDELQMLSGNIKVKTYDDITRQPIANVQVIYGCGDYASCNIGSTNYNATSGISSLTSKMPLCTNGYLLLTKNGYLDEKIPLTTEVNVNRDLGSIYMQPIISKNISIRKYYVYREMKDTEIFGGITVPMYTGRYILSNESYPLGVNDTVTITITKKINGVLDAPHIQTKIFTNESFKENQSIDLVTGRYAIEAQVIDNTGVFIYKECKEICWPAGFLGLGEDCKSIPEETINLTPATWGGIEFMDPTLFTLSLADLKANNTLEFYVIRMPNPRCLDDMSETSKIGAISKQYKNKLLPKFK